MSKVSLPMPQQKQKIGILICDGSHYVLHVYDPITMIVHNYDPMNLGGEITGDWLNVCRILNSELNVHYKPTTSLLYNITNLRRQQENDNKNCGVYASLFYFYC